MIVFFHHETVVSSLLKNSHRLNQAFFRLGAEEVGGLVSTITFEKLNYFTDVKSTFVDLPKEGKGEGLPDNKLRYNSIDIRRRIVEFFGKYYQINWTKK